MAAADPLRGEWSVDAAVWSVTSFSELAREAKTVARWNMLHAEEEPRLSHVERSLGGDEVTIAATDYVRAYPSLIAPFVKRRLRCTGTDGFGRSDTRGALRRFFEVDRHAIVVAALHRCAKRGEVSSKTVAEAIERYGLQTEAEPAWER